MVRFARTVAALSLLQGLTIGAARAEGMYGYDPAKSGPVSYGAAHALAPGVTARTIEYVSASGKKVTGEIITGSASSPQPGVLFVHWLGDTATTNHTEFERDAQALAGRGVTSILVDTIWSAPKWFEHMGASVEADSKETIDQVVDLRTALDVLTAQKYVDGKRIAFVGHDFGAMLGALMASVEARPQYFVYLAGNPVLTNWYTLGKKSPTHDQYVAAMAKFDILAALHSSKPKAVLMQFSAHDEYVSADEAARFFAAAPLPRGAFFYDVDHSLATPQAFKDRQAWLVEQLFGDTTR
jgi:dienelactone hydrolase